MSLFDVIRRINEEVDNDLNDGSVTPRKFGMVTGVTDGVRTVIKFENTIVWDSHVWEDSARAPMQSEEDHEISELSRMERSVRRAIGAHIVMLMNIRLD